MCSQGRGVCQQGRGYAGEELVGFVDRVPGYSLGKIDTPH